MGKKTAQKVKKEVIVANAEPTLTTASEEDLKKAEAEPAEPELTKGINETPSAVVKSSKKSVEGENIKRKSQGEISQHTKSIEKIVPPDTEAPKNNEEPEPKKKKKDSVDAGRIRASRDIRVSIIEKNEKVIQENEEVSEKGTEKPSKKPKSGKKGKKEKLETEDKEKIEKPKKAKAPAKPKAKQIDKATQKDKNEEMAVPAAESSGQIFRAESQIVISEKKQRSRVSIAKEAIKSEDTISKKRKKELKKGSSASDIAKKTTSETSQQRTSFFTVFKSDAEESSSEESEELLGEGEQIEKKKKSKKTKGEDTEKKAKKEKKKKEKEEKKEKAKEKKEPKKVEIKKDPVKTAEAEYQAMRKKMDELKKIAMETGILEEKAHVEEGPKKKMSKKEKARQTAEMAEKARQEMEAQMKRLEEMVKKKAEEDRLAAIENDRKDAVEHALRLEQLRDSFNLIQDISDYAARKIQEENEQLEWEKYLACEKLPNAAMCDQMNTYLHLWDQELEVTTVDLASQRTQDVLTLLRTLEELIDTGSNEDNSKLENWIWIRQLFREYQTASLDVATYKLLRNVEHNLNRINIPTADFSFKDDFVTLCIWLRVMLPIPLPNPRRPPKPRIDVNFELMETSVLFPATIDCENAAIRAMYLKYDHMSDLSETFHMPDVPKEYNMDLLEASKYEWRANLKYKYANRDKKKPPPVVQEATTDQDDNLGQKQTTDSPEGKTADTEPVIEPPTEPEDFNSDEEIPMVPFKQLKPTASQHVIMLEDNLYMETREKLQYNLPEDDINLREFVILGGVYHFNLLAQPPQPQDFITMEMTITGLYLPKKLEVLPFKVVYVPYVPPAEPEPTPVQSLTRSLSMSLRKMPEEVEDEIKKQEEALDKLIAVNIKWPQHVIFLELPVVCRWDEERRLWSREEILDVRHNEEKCIISFRTGVFGIYGLATYRYANLPFQAYDIKPEEDGSVTVQLTAAILMLEFNIKNGLICISQLQNSPNMTLQDVVGTYYKLNILKRLMKESGIDIFPAFDAFCYVKGTSEKQWPMEKHLYYNIAQISNSFNFSWSRWNVQAGRRKIVLQMRQYLPDKGKQKNHQMLLVTPLKATFIDCTEVSQVFSEKEVESLKFCADLYHLMKTTSGIFIRNKVTKASKDSVCTLAQFLISTRIFSFS